MGVNPNLSEIFRGLKKGLACVAAELNAGIPGIGERKLFLEHPQVVKGLLGCPSTNFLLQILILKSH